MDKTQEASDKIVKLVSEKKSARDFQLRKHTGWNENYELYRNKVKTNRLTQRQAVNVPLMKETVKTLLSKVDDPPSVEWKEKSGDDMKELIYQQIWDDNFDTNSLELVDVLDKKNVFLYGISSKMLNLTEKGVSIDVLDVFDVIYDPLMDPLDVETARYIVRQNIFKPLRDILVDDRYTQSGKDKLKDWIATEKGMIVSGQNKEQWDKKQERLRAMGVSSDKFPLYSGGDVLINLTEQYTNIWNAKTKKFERHVITYADDMIELYDDLLENCIGTSMWPIEPWYEDPETNDIYPDGVCDMIQPMNKVINVWFSQQIENRTLQNFQMHWYDATNESYAPQTYEPGPGRMLPAPGDPNKTILPVQINGLDETMTAIDFLTSIIERGTGATALEKGTPEQGAQTLGEVQILVGKATERAKTMAKFYRTSWYKIAVKWNEMMQNNTFPKMSLFKTGSDGKVYEKIVYSADWKSKAGYAPSVASSSEQEADEMKSLQKFGVVAAQFPNNVALRKILQTRELKTLDLTASELKEIQDEEDRMAKEQQMAKDQAQSQAQAVNQDVQPDIAASINDSLNQIGQLTA